MNTFKFFRCTIATSKIIFKASCDSLFGYYGSYLSCGFKFKSS